MQAAVAPTQSHGLILGAQFFMHNSLKVNAAETKCNSLWIQSVINSDTAAF